MLQVLQCGQGALIKFICSCNDFKRGGTLQQHTRRQGLQCAHQFFTKGDYFGVILHMEITQGKEDVWRCGVCALSLLHDSRITTHIIGGRLAGNDCLFCFLHGSIRADAGTKCKPKPTIKMSINIKDLDKAEVLQALYANSKAQGVGAFLARPGGMTIEQARELVAQTLDYDYLAGRVMKVNLAGDELDERLYDRDLGDGAAYRAIEHLIVKRDRKPNNTGFGAGLHNPSEG